MFFFPDALVLVWNMCLEQICYLFLKFTNKTPKNSQKFHLKYNLVIEKSSFP